MKCAEAMIAPHNRTPVGRVTMRQMFKSPTRRAVVLGAAGVPFALRGAVPPADNWLLTDRQEIEAAKLKAAKIPEVIDNKQTA